MITLIHVTTNRTEKEIVCH